MYLGDFFTSDVVYKSFNTVGAGGAPATLSGSPVIKVMKDDGTTQSTAGITTVVDLASTTGLNSVKIDTSADGTFYASGHEFFIVVTAGTVGGQSIAGYVVGSFSLANRTGLRPATKGRTAALDSSGRAGIDWSNVGAPTTTVGLSGTTIKEVTDVETKLGNPAGASVSADIAAVKSDTNTLTGRLTSGRATALDHLDADVSSRLATIGYTAPSNAAIAAIQAKTDNLPSDPADQSLIIAATDALSTLIGTIKTKTDQLSFSGGGVVAHLAAGQIAVKKNTALAGFSFPMFSSTTHAPAAGLTVAIQRSIDGGAFAACTNPVTEISGGAYSIDLSAADLNGNVITFKATATGGDATIFTVVTQS